MTGRLYGIGIGPGDPELMTLKAVRLIGEADVVALPDGGTGRSMATSTAGDLLAGKEIAWCPVPMTHDKETLHASHVRTADLLCDLLDAGKMVVYLCLGDVTLFSSFMYVHDLVRNRGYNVELVPGISSVGAASARLGTSLCQGNDRLLIVSASDDNLDEVLDFNATKVLLKSGRDTQHLKEALRSHGLLDSTSVVSRCSMPDELVVENLAESDKSLGYLTVYLVR